MNADNIIPFPQRANVKTLSRAEKLRLLSEASLVLADLYAALADGESVSDGPALDEALR